MLLLDPGSGTQDLDQKLAASGISGVALDDDLQMLGLGLAEGTSAAGETPVGGYVHGNGRQRAGDATLKASQNQDSRAIQVTTVLDGDTRSAGDAKKLHDRPICLPPSQDDELAQGRVVKVIDIIEKGCLILDHEHAIDLKAIDRSMMKLAKSQSTHVSQPRVLQDVIEFVPAPTVDQGTKAVDCDGSLVAANSVDLQGRAQSLRIGHGSQPSDLIGELVVIQQSLAQATKTVGAHAERLAVTENIGGEICDANGPGVGKGGIDGAREFVSFAERSVDSFILGHATRLAPGLELGQEKGAGRFRLAAKLGQSTSEAGIHLGTLGSRVSRRAIEGRIEELVEGTPELLLASQVGDLEVELDSARLRGADSPLRKHGDKRLGCALVDTQGNAAGNSPAMLALVENRAEDSGSRRRLRHHAANGDNGLLEHDESDNSIARRLLGDERETAFADGCAPALALALSSATPKVLSSERTPQYLTLLYALLLFRRGHELSPRHEDLYARVLGPLAIGGDNYGPELFASDLRQLREWGAVEEQTEAARLRGYKDNRRVQYRYQLSEDAAALLEWLESRLAARIEGRIRDSRDRLADVIGFLKECRRRLGDWRNGDNDSDVARRAYYLLEAANDAVTGIADELLAFRADMIAFSQRPYSVEDLRDILAWLEHYVDQYVRRVRKLRIEIRDRLTELLTPRYRRALAECDLCLAEERAAMPRIARAPAALRPADQLLAHMAGFFRQHGQLDGLSKHIDDSVRQVVGKMHRHVRELERRNARLDDVRATISSLAKSGEPAPGYADHLLASAHGRFDHRAGTSRHRVAPPSPRKHQLAPNRRASARALQVKKAAPKEARALRAKALSELALWIHDRVLRCQTRASLADAKLQEQDDLRKWMDAMRCQKLAGGKHMSALGVTIREGEGRVQLGDDECGMSAPGADVSLRTNKKRRNT